MSIRSPQNNNILKLQFHIIVKIFTNELIVANISVIRCRPIPNDMKFWPNSNIKLASHPLELRLGTFPVLWTSVGYLNTLSLRVSLLFSCSLYFSCSLHYSSHILSTFLALFITLLMFSLLFLLSSLLLSYSLYFFCSLHYSSHILSTFLALFITLLIFFLLFLLSS